MLHKKRSGGGGRDGGVGEWEEVFQLDCDTACLGNFP